MYTLNINNFLYKYNMYSDMLFNCICPPPQKIHRVQTFKGFFFNLGGKSISSLVDTVCQPVHLFCVTLLSSPSHTSAMGFNEFS